MNMMADMGFELDPEEGLKQIRTYPKIARAETFGADNETLVIQTNDMYLYTPDRSVRGKLGTFTIVLYPDRIMMKNSSPIDERGAWRNKDKTKKTQSSTSPTTTSWETMHHPHIPGSYVSLAAHEDPLLDAIVKKDWVSATNTVIAFLEAYKFGDKAKDFFKRHMEVKNEKTGQWEVVAFDEDHFQAGDLQGQYYGSSWSSGPDKEIEEFAQKAPKGSRVKLAWTNAHGSPPIGTEGTVEGFSYTTVKVKWDNGSHWTLMPTTGDDVDILSVPEGHDPKKKPDRTIFGHSHYASPHGTYSQEKYKLRQKVKDLVPLGSKIRVVKPAEFHHDNLPAGSVGVTTKIFGENFDMKWEDERLFSVINPIEDVFEIIEYPANYVPSGTRVKLTSLPSWEATLKVGAEGTVKQDGMYTMDVEWDDVEGKKAPWHMRTLQKLTEINLKNGWGYELEKPEDANSDLPKLIDFTDGDPDEKIKDEAKTDARPPIQEFSASSGVTQGSLTSSTSDDEEDEYGLYGRYM